MSVPVSEGQSTELAHTVQELATRCRSACESYKAFAEDLVNLVADQQDVLQQHEDLLARASVELMVCTTCPSISTMGQVTTTIIIWIIHTARSVGAPVLNTEHPLRCLHCVGLCAVVRIRQRFAACKLT